VLLLKTFGGLSLARDGVPVEGAGAQRRRLALLAVLAVAGERGVGREKILALLWPSSDPERGRKSLAQAVYALRREFGAEDLIVGTTELRLGWDGFVSDLADFRTAFADRRYGDAVALYEGPFLDGVYLDEAPEFERWAETERSTLAHDYVVALERLAREADQQHEPRTAVGWWRKLANADPLNGQVALGLMRSLTTLGDRGAALQHFRVYEMLLRQELDLSPDPELRRLAEELRQTPAPAKRPPQPPGPLPPAVHGVTPPAGPGTEVPITTVPRTPAVRRPAADNTGPGRFGISGMTDEYARPRPLGERPAPPLPGSIAPLGQAVVRKPFLARTSTRHGMLLGFALGLLVMGIAMVRRSADRREAKREIPVVAVGLIRDYTSTHDGLTRPLADMLATNLARAEGMQVVSTARMYELMAQQATTDSVAATMGAARAAGATELLDGSLIDSGGTYRLDLRRTRLSTGSLGGALRVSGKSLFALVEAGTDSLVRSLGAKGPQSTLAEVSTGSLVAYRLYEEGLRALFNGQSEPAQRLLGQALAEDSSFAMAAYWLARSGGGDRGDLDMLKRAVDLSVHATDRERLLIRAGWADLTDDPSRLATAESLTTRYPAEPEGYLWLGHARKWTGDFAGALAPLERVVAMDSLGLSRDPRAPGAPPRCLACEAVAELAGTYHMMDSLDAAERVLRDWIRRQPGNPSAWGLLAGVLAFSNRFDEALAAERTVSALSPQVSQEWFRAHVSWRAGRFRTPDSLFRAMAQSPGGGEGLKWLSISLRTQGRVREALSPSQRLRATMTAPRKDAVPYVGLFEAQVWFDLGEYRRAAAVFDSISRAPLYSVAPQIARNLVWTQTLRATALAAAGDTLLLPVIADSVELWGRRSGYGRDRRLHHHIRGLLLEARGNLEGAAGEYRQAMFSATLGYTRTNLNLGRVLLRLGRPGEAAELAESALRGAYESTGTYVTMTELAELAAIGWDEAGVKARAIARYQQVLANWAHADPQFQPRIERARLRLAALSGQ
jgi:DNA-binding SARP family transcriptional activator/tetratricopeptide (TPR) repeat protein